MTALSIQPTFPTFTGADGQPLENGYIWIGTANLNPITNPITVYWDAALSAPATQPIRTLGGYPSNSGTPARMYVNSDYSIQVLDRKGSVVYSAPVATERYGGGIINAADVVYDPAGTGAVATTVQAKLRESVSVLDFGADPTGATDSSSAVNSAVAYLQTLGGGDLIFPPGKYLFNSSIVSSSSVNGVRFIGQGGGRLVTGDITATTLIQNFTGTLFNVNSWDMEWHDLSFRQNGTLGAWSTYIYISPNSGYAMNCKIDSCSFYGGQQHIVGVSVNRFFVSNNMFIGDANTTTSVYVLQSTGNNPAAIYIDSNVFATYTAVGLNSKCIHFDSVDTTHVFQNEVLGWGYGVYVTKTYAYTNNLIHIYKNNFEVLLQYPISMDTAGNVWIEGNEIVGSIGGTAVRGISTSAVSNLNIANNTITGYKQEAIYCAAGTQVTIANNKINDVSQQTDATYGAVSLLNFTTGTITGNLFSSNDNQVNKPSAYVKVGSASADIVISGNKYNPNSPLFLNDGTATNISAYDAAYSLSPPFNSTYNSGAISISASSDAVAASVGTLSLTIPINTIYGSTGTFAGIFTVSSIRNSGFSVNTTTVYSVSGKGTNATFTSLNSTNGTGGSNTFSLALSANGVITFTNTQANEVNATIAFFGIVGAGS